MENYILKCSLCSGMGYTEDKCWKKNNKGPSASTNFLEVMVNDEETTLVELNHLCGVNNNIFSSVKMLKRRLHVQASTINERLGEVHEDESREVRIDGNIRSKILSYFKGNFILMPMETILIVHGQLKYLEGLVKLARKKKDVENNLVLSYNSCTYNHHKEGLH